MRNCRSFGRYCGIRFPMAMWQRSSSERSTPCSSMPASRSAARDRLVHPPQHPPLSTLPRRALLERSRLQFGAWSGRGIKGGAATYRATVGDVAPATFWSSTITCPGPAASNTVNPTSICAVVRTINMLRNWTLARPIWLPVEDVQVPPPVKWPRSVIRPRAPRLDSNPVEARMFSVGQTSRSKSRN